MNIISFDDFKFWFIELIEYNYQISKEWYRIEQSFGGLKKHFGWDRSIYMGLKKKSDYLILEAIAFNLKRSIKILRAWERRDTSKFWVESKKMMGKRVWKGEKVKSWREKGISTDMLKINPQIRTLISSLIIIQ